MGSCTYALTVVVGRYIGTSLINTRSLYYSYQKLAIRRLLLTGIGEGATLSSPVKNVEYNTQENRC